MKFSWKHPCGYCGGPGGYVRGEGHTFGCPRYKGPGPREPREKKPRAKRPPETVVGKRAYARRKISSRIPAHSRGTIRSVLGNYYVVDFDHLTGFETHVRRDLMIVDE